MSRPKRITLNAVNITVHPHTPLHYAQLWAALFNLRRAVDIGRDQGLMIGSIDPVDPKNLEAGYVGLLFRFTIIDKNKGWFDIQSGEEADGDTIKREVKIPDHLRPNLSTFHYRLFPKNHRLIVESKNENGDGLGAASVVKMLSFLITDPKITKRFENVDVTMEQSEEEILEIITGKNLKHLKIIVKRPNPDDDSDADEREVLGELLEEKARSKTVELAALSGESIKPNSKTKKYARVASSNGKVTAIVETADGSRVPVSSSSHPRVDQHPYSEKKQTRTDAFFDAALNFADTIAKKRTSEHGDAHPVI